MCKFQNLHIIVLRKLYGFKHDDPTHDVKIQAAINLPAPLLMFRIKRLIHLPRLCQHAPLPLKSLIANLSNIKGSWYDLICSDLEWESFSPYLLLACFFLVASAFLN